MKTLRTLEAHPRRPRTALPLLASLLLVLLPAGTAMAQHVAHWQGDSLLGNEWSRLGNWAQLIYPDNDGDDVASFDDRGEAHSVFIDEPSRIKTIYISDTQTYLFTGSQLTLVDGGISMSGIPSANHGFLSPVRFEGTSGSIDNKSPAQLTLTGDVSLAVSHSVSVQNNANSPVQIRGRISGSVVSFGKSGEGLLRLDSNNSYTGQTSIHGGVLRTEAVGALGVGSVYVSGGVLDLHGLDTTVGPGATSEAGIKLVEPGGSILLGGTDNTLTISTLGIWIEVYAGGSSTIEEGWLDLATSAGTREIRFQLDTDRLRIDSNIMGGGVPSSAPSLRKSGPGHLTLGGANTFTRALQVTGGTVTLSHTQALGSAGADHGTILAGGDLILDLPPGSDAIAESLVFDQPGRIVARADGTWTGPVAISAPAAEWSIDPGGRLTVSGPVRGEPGEGIRKSGGGALFLNGDNSYTGGTVVEAGTLEVDATSGSATGTGPVTVRSGAMLSARGGLDGGVILESQGSLRAGSGSSTEFLSMPSLQVQAGAELWLDVDASEPTLPSDRLDVGGTTELAGTLHVSAQGEPSAGDTFTLLSWAGRVGSFDAVELPALSDTTLTWQVDYEPDGLRLSVRGSVTAAGERPGSSVMRLHVPAPNPTGHTTSLRFDLARAGRVDLLVYDLRGRRVAALVEGVPHRAGSHVARWNGRDDRGRAVASGAYFAQLRVDGAPVGETRRLVVRR